MTPAAAPRHWVPGVRVWYGIYTRSWWAFVPGVPDLLIEAHSPDLLAQRLTALSMRAAGHRLTPPPDRQAHAI
ncbi:hypothetical protein GWI34_02865 [Actinomadura sp. DSM 109109]|nr:hypothetical protein [Actinomadura lepetitiana]